MFVRRPHQIKAACLLLAILCIMLSFCACDNTENPYSKQNSFDVKTTDTVDALTFEPIGFRYTYGLVFYVGALIEPRYYEYLGRALASKGYLVVIPKLENNMANIDYPVSEDIFSQYPQVRFFVGGHDIGGGAAVRRAGDYPTYVKGVILYTPLGFSKQKFDGDNLVFDDDGLVVWEHFSIANHSIPTLLIEADSILRTEAMKAEAAEHINIASTTLHTLTNSSPILFSTAPLSSTITEEQAEAQRLSTVEFTLEFMKGIIV